MIIVMIFSYDKTLVMIKDKLGTEVWTSQAKINNEIFSLNLQNTNGLEIVN